MRSMCTWGHGDVWAWAAIKGRSLSLILSQPESAIVTMVMVCAEAMPQNPPSRLDRLWTQHPDAKPSTNSEVVSVMTAVHHDHSSLAHKTHVADSVLPPS